MSGIFEQLTFGWRSALMGSVLLPIIASATLLAFRAADRQASRWLIALVFCTVSSSIPFFIGFAGAYDAWPGLTFLPVDTTLAFAPLLYIYVHTCLTGQKPGWRWWLLLPAAVHFVYQLGAFTLLGDYQNKWAFTASFHGPYVEPVVRVLSLALSTGAWIAVHRLYKRYRQWLPTARADEDNFQPLWLNYFIALFGFIGTLWIAITFMELSDSYNYRGRYWLVIVSLSALLLILLETLSRSRISFPKMPAESGATDDDEHERESSQNWQELGQKLKRQIIDNQWFLESDFSLATMATRVGVNRSYASRALNEGLDQNFSELVNTLRVAHARDLLTSSNDKLLDIAYQSGFGSKASFNRVFRSFEGRTPGEFRRQNVS